MKTTPEKLVVLKVMAVHARSHFCIELAEALVRDVPDLIADLEEAQEQLASPYMDGYEAAKAEYRPQIIAAEAELDTTRKQLAEAQAQLAAKDSLLMDALPFVSRLVTSDTIAAIAEAIEPYRKDTERLDLLGKLCKETPLRPNAFCSEIAPDTRLKYEFPTLVSYDAIGQQISLRDAIDAAIAAKGESE